MGRFSRYEFVQKIALGGMAEVWSAWAVSPDGSKTDVVVKRILPQFAGDEKFQSMLLEEAEVTARLQHPNIVQVYDWGHLDDTCFLAMERVVGLDGRQLIDACAMRNIRIAPEIALYTMGEIFKGLDVAHRATDGKGHPLGIVHRDVSPSNVLLSLKGDVKLADFGIAKAKSRASHTVAGQVRGKPRYMSPEQAKGEELDGRSDLFTAGIVLHEMLTGKPVFPPSSFLDEVVEVIKKGVPAPSKVNPYVPAEIDALVLALCERDLAKRVKTGAAAYQLIVEWAAKNKMKLGPQPVAELVTSIVRPTQEKKPSTAPKSETRIMRIDDVDGMPMFSTQGKMLDPDPAPPAVPPAPRLSPSGIRRMQEHSRERDPVASTSLMEMPISSDDVPPEPEDDGPTNRRRAPARTVVGAVPPSTDAPADVATEPPSAALYDIATRPPTPSPDRRSGSNTAGIAAASALVAVAIAIAAWWTLPTETEAPGDTTATPELALDFEAAAAALAAQATPVPTAEEPATPPPGPERTRTPARTSPLPAAGTATKRPKATPTATAAIAAPVATGPGWLTLRSKPAGEVTIDGQWAGTTPLTKHELPSGVHTVVVNSEDGRSATSQVIIIAGETTPVSLTLQ